MTDLLTKMTRTENGIVAWTPTCMGWLSHWVVSPPAMPPLAPPQPHAIADGHKLVWCDGHDVGEAEARRLEELLWYGISAEEAEHAYQWARNAERRRLLEDADAPQV